MGRFVKGDIVDSNARPNRLSADDANIILYKAAALELARLRQVRDWVVKVACS